MPRRTPDRVRPEIVLERVHAAALAVPGETRRQAGALHRRGRAGSPIEAIADDHGPRIQDRAFAPHASRDLNRLVLVPRPGPHVTAERAVGVQGEVDLVAQDERGVALGVPAGVGIDEAHHLLGVPGQDLGHALAGGPDLYERAQALARKGHIIVGADEKTSIQARRACGRMTPVRPGRPWFPNGRPSRCVNRRHPSDGAPCAVPRPRPAASELSTRYRWGPAAPGAGSLRRCVSETSSAGRRGRLAPAPALWARLPSPLLPLVACDGVQRKAWSIDPPRNLSLRLLS